MKFGVFLGTHDIPDQGKTPAQIYDEAIEQAQLAEELGFDYVWIPEHDIVRFMIATDLLQLAVLIADRTKRIRIGAGVFVTSLMHPLLLAGDIVQADHLTRGRFEPGLGRGGSLYELRQLGGYLPEEESRERFEEFVSVIRQDWTSAHGHAFEGRFFQFDNVLIQPRPFSDPHPRIWLAATSPQSIERSAALGYDVQFTCFRRPFSVVGEAVAAFERGKARADNGHELELMVSRQTYVAPTMEDARAILPVIDYHEHVVGAGRIDAERVVDGVRGWDEDADLGLSDDEYMRRMPIGDPDTVLEHLVGYRDAGVTHYCMYTSLGQPQDQVLRSMELFATRVLPHLR
jgi:alkanesulfonate monooxygenase SsuD/methylene tetrahydromethanopterin reductase-like flavin-dependent oxidoreductase (luciferase family)